MGVIEGMDRSLNFSGEIEREGVEGFEEVQKRSTFGARENLKGLSEWKGRSFPMPTISHVKYKLEEVSGSFPLRQREWNYTKNQYRE